MEEDENKEAGDPIYNALVQKILTFKIKTYNNNRNTNKKCEDYRRRVQKKGIYLAYPEIFTTLLYQQKLHKS